MWMPDRRAVEGHGPEFLGRPQHPLSNNLTISGNPTSSPFAIDDKVYQGVDNFSWVVGKHSLRMGGEYRYNQFPQVGNEFPRGQFFFTGAFTSNANTQSGGYSGADCCWATRSASISPWLWFPPISAITNGRPISTTPGRSRRA